MLKIVIPSKFEFLLKNKARFKVCYGGRGGGKTENIARAMLILAMQPQHLFKKDNIRILCVREYQSSIAHSVHKILTDLIMLYELYPFFNNM